MSSPLVSLVILALAAAACSGGDRAADATQPPPPPTTPATTAALTTPAPNTTTTTAPPTTVPATTTPPTTAPPTTPAPTVPIATASTLPLPTPEGFTAEEVQAIDRDLREGYRRLFAAFIDVNDEAAVQAALEYTTGGETDNVNSLVELFRTNNRRLELLPTPPESFEILQGPTRLANGDIGLQLCHVAPYRTLQTGDGSGTSETILNGGVLTELLSVDLRLEDGVWKRSANFTEGQWQGVVRCQDVS